MYKLIRPLLFRSDPETAARLTRSVARFFGATPFRALLKAWYGFEDKRLNANVFGLLFKNPIGLAPGFDKNAEIIPALTALGFGFLEIGTVTPQPHEGNPKPRLFRLPQDEAIINRMGFNGLGADVVGVRFKATQKTDCVLGINIGKNKDSPNEKAREEYILCFKTLSPYADYIVVNVSSPNTAHLRELQEKNALTNLLQGLQEENQKAKIKKPILLKVAPDLSDGQLDDVVSVSQKVGIDGIIATNTTVARTGLVTPKERIEAMGQGGLSGKPLREASTRIISYLYKRLRGTIPIIGAGGIFSAEDAYEKICAGATLVEVYTGLVYEGPGLVKKIKKGLVRLLERDGFKTIQEAVGSKNK